MSGTLFLFPLAEEPAAFGWARRRSRGGGPASGRATAQERLETAPGERIVLIAPGEEVGLFAVEPPTRSERQALAAARFAVEDDLAQPLESVHVQLAERPSREPGRWREAVVVAARRLAAWREALDAIGAAPDHVVPDYAALAVGPGEVLVVDLGDRVLARGRGLGLAVDAALAPSVLSAALARRPDDAVRLLSDRPDAVLPPAAREGRRVDAAPSPSDSALLALFEEGLADGPSIDLARAWRTRAPRTTLALGPWRAAAALTAAAAVTFLALLAAETVTLRAHAAAAEAESEQLLRGAFPEMGRLVNPRAQLRERLGARGAGGSASFLELSAMLSESVAPIDAMQIESLRYDAADGALSAALAYAAYADIERLKAAVEARGGRLTEGAARMRGDRMTGDVTVARP